MIKKLYLRQLQEIMEDRLHGVLKKMVWNVKFLLAILLVKIEQMKLKNMGQKY